MWLERLFGKHESSRAIPVLGDNLSIVQIFHLLPWDFTHKEQQADKTAALRSQVGRQTHTPHWARGHPRWGHKPPSRRFPGPLASPLSPFGPFCFSLHPPAFSFPHLLSFLSCARWAAGVQTARVASRQDGTHAHEQTPGLLQDGAPRLAV